MDTFLNGLDGRLKVSGMVADSIMMGIVNSAMEDAFKKSCSKAGDLERLNGKSRFCELAIMQLEWCLKYLQEETDSNIFYHACDREDLLYDLLETRDRIHHRLEETELAIAEKDRELLERRETEVDLKLALELKDEDILSLNAALGLERENTERADRSSPRKKKIVEKKGIHAINKLKDSVDHQIRKMKGKLLQEKLILVEMLKGQHSGLLSLESLESRYDLDVQERSEGIDVGQVVNMIPDGARTLNRELMAQLVLDLDDMVVDINILKEKFNSSFRMMANSISSFKAVLNEKQWNWSFEKETISIITSDFLKNMQGKFSDEIGGPEGDLMPVCLNMNWSNLVDDIRNLHCGLEMLAHHYPPISLNVGGQDNLTCSTSLRSNSSIGKYVFSRVLDADVDGSFISRDDPCRVDCVDLPANMIIRSNDHVVKKKSQDISWMVRELVEGRSLSSRNDEIVYSVEEILAQVVPKLDLLIKENTKLSALCNDHPSLNGKDQNLIQCSVSELPLYEDSSNNEFHEERRKFEQEKLDLKIKFMICDDTYLVQLGGLIERIHLKSIECDIGAKIMEETCEIIFNGIFKEWRSFNEIYKVERLIMEEICSLVFTRVVKDSILSLGFTLKEHPREGGAINKLVFQSCQSCGDKFNQVYKQPQTSIISFDLVGHDLKELAGNYSEHAQLLNCHETFDLVNAVFHKPMQQIALSEFQFGEFTTSLGSACWDTVSTSDQENFLMRHGQHARWLPQKFEHKLFCQLQCMLASFSMFSQLFEGFELVVHDKMRLNAERLEYLTRDLKPLAQQVKSVKQNESLYRKAFTRRCYDLRTAEKEVDLLGDQVDVLHSLIEKTYLALLHYSPNLQHISDIMDVLSLIQRELRGQRTSIPMH